MKTLLIAMREYGIFFFGGLAVATGSVCGLWSSLQPDPAAAQISQFVTAPAITYGPAVFSIGLSIGIGMSVVSVVKAYRF
jgi:hypothetical protein